ncbi:MAG: phosphatase PAP2 family protein [Anaerolineae bacterium]
MLYSAPVALPLPLVALALALGAAMAWAVVAPGAPALDGRLFLALNGRPLPAAAEVGVRLVSHLGLFPTNAALWGGYLLVVGVPSGTVGPGVAAAGGLVGVWAACRAIKMIVNRQRPHGVIDGARLVGLTPSGSAFPSSHAALSLYSAAVATELLALSRLEATAAFALALGVALARVYIGAHYPRDVLGGALIGAAGAIVSLVAAGGSGGG